MTPEEKIDEIEKLEDGWDYPETPAVSKKAIAKARSILPQLKHPPRVFPTARGTLQFEYGNPRKSHLEIEFRKDGSCDVLWQGYPYGGAEFVYVSDRLLLVMVDKFLERMDNDNA